jgi:hypothetical protein
LDYYRKLNEASRRNLEQPTTPVAATPVSSAHDIQEKEAAPSTTDESRSREQQLQHTISIEDEKKNSIQQQQLDHPIIVGAAPTTPINRERYNRHDRSSF